MNILEGINYVRKQIEERGQLVHIPGKNKDDIVFGEIIGLTVTISDVSYVDAYDDVLKYFQDRGGLKIFYERLEQESYHYSFLKFGLLQKIEFNKFYFGENPIGSRKLIIHSEDCISAVQVLARKSSMEVSVFMRSSEVVELLPIDILGLIGLLEEVRKEIYIEHSDSKKISINLNIFIGSAHIYDCGNPRKVILKGYNYGK